MSEEKNYSGQLLLHNTSRKISRDEMNLAEFPLTVLSTRANPNLKTLEFKDSIKGRNGEVLERKWIITGADKFGLPTSSDDEVLLGLLKLTVDDGMRDRKIYFTRYELLRTLKWTTEGRSYVRLQKALDRLSGVRIKASNAFFDNDTKIHSTRNFGIIDAYEIQTGADSKSSYFTWSETLFKSFQVGFIKKLDLEFYLELKSAVSKRLYRYLDKHFWYKSRVTIDLFTLAHEKVGISRTYQFSSSIRQILDPAIEELIQAGFLASYEYIGKGKNTEVVLTAAKVKSSLPQNGSEKFMKSSDVNTSSDSDNSLRDDISRLLIGRGIKEQQVMRLIGTRSEETLKRISQIISYFDFLVASGSRLVSKSPVGFLYRAVENPEIFVLPGENQKKNKQEALPLKQEQETSKNVVNSSQKESEYLIAGKTAILKYRQAIDADLLIKITEEVRTALSKIKGLISPTRFEEAVSHGVEEKIAKLFEFPSFDEWVTSAKGKSI